MAKNTMGFRDAYTQTLDIDIYPKGNDGADGVSIVDVEVNNNNTNNKALLTLFLFKTNINPTDDTTNNDKYCNILS